MGKRYGSKAAYDEAKRIRNMSEEDRIKQRNAERLNDDAMMLHTMFMASALAGGDTAPRADKTAAACVELLKARFT